MDSERVNKVWPLYLDYPLLKEKCKIKETK
jgi:hypothetical protein